MTITTADPSRLSFYTQQPLGRLAKKLSLSASSVFFLYATISFGGSIVFQTLFDRTPLPSSWQGFFKLPPPGTYYFPNLFSLVFDLIAGPLIIALAVLAQNYIPDQFQLLADQQIITLKQRPSTWWRKLLANTRAMLWVGQIFAAVVALGILVSGITTTFRDFSSGSYSLVFASILSAIGFFVRSLIVLDYVYLVALLSNYELTPQLRLMHPDGCGGLKPFGEFAKLAYYFLFIHTIMLIVLTMSSDSFALLRRIDQYASVILQLLITLVFFPLCTGWLAYYFLYVPHQKLEDLKTRYLDEISKKLTQRKENIFHAQGVAEKEKTIETTQEKTVDPSDEELIKTYNQIRDIPSWPITKDFFKYVLPFINPVIPAIIALGNQVANSIITQLTN